MANSAQTIDCDFSGFTVKVNKDYRGGKIKSGSFWNATVLPMVIVWQNMPWGSQSQWK